MAARIELQRPTDRRVLRIRWRIRNKNGNEAGLRHLDTRRQLDATRPSATPHRRQAPGPVTDVIR